KEAIKDPFFDQYWSSVRGEAGIAPRRNKSDLKWRFWDNPYNNYQTLVFDNAYGNKGYLIINTTDPYYFRLDDFFFSDLKLNHWIEIFETVKSWSRSKGAILLSHLTTENAYEVNCLEALRESFKEGIFLSSPLKRIQERNQVMPRCILNSELHNKNWNITPIIMEGRR
ncbi:hypothetical protein ABMA58_18230, partial [Oceanospirillum sp. HFRX-1_2]